MDVRELYLFRCVALCRWFSWKPSKFAGICTERMIKQHWLKWVCFIDRIPIRGYDCPCSSAKQCYRFSASYFDAVMCLCCALFHIQRKFVCKKAISRFWLCLLVAAVMLIFFYSRTLRIFIRRIDPCWRKNRITVFITSAHARSTEKIKTKIMNDY